jgi:putative SOS response-associated peptidase YedK
MCSHYTYNKYEAKLKLRDQILVLGFVPRGDIRPTDLGPVIIPEHEGYACRQMTWGWRVPWDKKPIFNANSETITRLATFQPHLRHRCLILADGFFEKGIHFIQPGERLFAMAGLWADNPQQNGNFRSASTGERIKGEVSKPIARSFLMLTTTPNASVSPYHHRMPFILRPEQLGAWLGDDWPSVLEKPDRTELEKIQKQPELF